MQDENMDRLKDYTKKVARQLDTDLALSTLNKFYFNGSKPRRFISGVAISSRDPNENNIAFVARGVDFSLPTTLLWNHQWERPLGRVIGIDIRGDQVRFKAEIGNNMSWVEQIWAEIKAQNAARVSVEGDSLVDPIIDRTFTRWRLTEISVAQSGADKGAFIERCWTKSPVVYLDGRPSETVHWEKQWK